MSSAIPTLDIARCISPVSAADREAFTSWWLSGSGSAGELGLNLARTLLLAGLAGPG